MLRAQLQDAAVSAAKSYGHASVEPRHVLFAIARRFRDHAELKEHAEGLRQALEPRGTAHKAPAVGDDAAALLASITNEIEAIAAVVSARRGGPDPAGAEASAKRPAGDRAVAAAATAATPPATPTPTPAEILTELESLIGLGPVKAQVRSVIAVVQANTQRKKAGLAAVNPSLHLVFTGPPGTGKTTVARLVARLYGATGALPGAGFTEASRADLVAGYVGQTAIKTSEVIARTRPGVLFIDEAYALSSRGGNDFGSEAIATLVKAMEDHRSELAVIVAGYSAEMADFVGSNPGLRSRFKTYIDFPDYSAAELLEIFERFAKESGIELAPGARERAESTFADAVLQPDFGNARFARSLFEQAYSRMAARAAADGVVEVSELMALQPEDIALDPGSLRREQRRMGFLGDDKEG